MENTNTAPEATVINNHMVQAKPGNGLGTAGFVLALIGLFVGWIPFVGNLIWFLGAVFSVIGIFKPSKGLAIAGTVISFIGLIVMVTLFGGLALLG